MVLAAAVGVGVLGLAAVNLPQLSGGFQGAGDGSSDQAGDATTGDKTGTTTEGKSASGADQPSASTPEATSRLSTDTFRRDVRRLLAAGADTPAAGAVVRHQRPHRRRARERGLRRVAGAGSGPQQRGAARREARPARGLRHQGRGASGACGLL